MKLGSLSIAVALATAAAVSTAAYAEDTHNSGFFVGAGAGYNNINLPGAFSVTNEQGQTKALNNTSYKKYMLNAHGGYLFNVGSNFDVGPMFGFDYYGAYTGKLASNNATQENFHIYELNLQAAAQYTWQSFFARANAGVGYFMVRGNKSGSDPANLNNNDQQWKAIAGLSAGYYFTPSFDVGLFYQHVFGSTLSDNQLVPRMNSVGLSLEYAFGGMNSASA